MISTVICQNNDYNVYDLMLLFLTKLKKKIKTKKNKLLNISIEHRLHKLENVVSYYYLIFDRDIAY